MTETVLPDIVETVFKLLKDGWTAGNTESRTPEFYKRKRQQARSKNVRNKDVVFIYDKALLEADVGIMAIHETAEHNVSVELHTFFHTSSEDARRHWNRMKSETNRIIALNHACPTSYARWNSATDKEQADFDFSIIRQKGSHILYDHPIETRGVLEFVGHIYYRVKQT